MAAGTMRAAWYSTYGAARDVLQVGALPIPEPGPGEVRVRVYASAVNPGDTKARIGMRGPMAFERIIPHSAGSGTVDAVGPGVDSRLHGRRVWVHSAQYGRQWGTAAEFTVVPAGCVEDLPASVSFIEGACLGIPAMTAHTCLFADGPLAGEYVLVVGGSGAVGRYAIGLAVWAGARVVATTGTKNLAALSASGAEAVFSREAPDLEERLVRAVGRKTIARIVAADLGVALSLAPAVLAERGTIAAYSSPSDSEPDLPFRPLMLRNAVIRLVYTVTAPESIRKEAAVDIIAALEQGVLSHPVGGVMSLDDVVAAHERVENPETRGVVVLDLGVS